MPYEFKLKVSIVTEFNHYEFSKPLPFVLLRDLIKIYLFIKLSVSFKVHFGFTY